MVSPMHGWKARRDAARKRMLEKNKRISGRREALQKQRVEKFAKKQEAAAPEPPPPPAQPATIVGDKDGFHIKHGGFGRYYLMNGEEQLSGPHKKDEAEALLAQATKG